MHNNSASDSETVNGNIVCWCNDSGKCLVTPTIDEILAFTTKNNRKRRYFFFNLMFDGDSVFKMLPLENLNELLGVQANTQYKDYNLTYLGRNNISISTRKKGSKKRTMWWDLAQFYDFHRLSEMSKLYLPKEGWKQDSEVIQHFVSEEGNTLEYFYNHENEIKEYCVQDCITTKMLADHMEERMEEEGYDFTTPYSVGNTAMKYARQFLINPANEKYPIPRIHPTHWSDENSEIRNLENIWEGIARGGWNDTFQRGKFDEIWDYDIVSAYPSIMKDLPYWDGKWEETKDITEIVKADYGLTDVNISNLKVPLLPETCMYFDDTIVNKKLTRWVNHTVLHCTINTQELHTTLTTDQLRYLSPISDIEVIGGWILKPNRGAEHKKPMEDLINSLIGKKMNAKRDKGKKSVEYMLAKKMMNSMSGKFKQKFHSKYTWFFYPHVYSKITWDTKKTIADLITKNNAWEDVVSISTDGAVFAHPLKHVDLSGELGSFELIKLHDFVQVGNGVYWGYDKNNELIQKMRGFNIFKYNLPELIESHPTETTVEIRDRRPLHLRECWRHHKKLSISDTNRFVKTKKHVDINKNIKRQWHEEYKDIADMLSGRILKSTAWEIRDARVLSKEADKQTKLPC